MRIKRIIGSFTLLLLLASPSYAIFGVGDVVFDPSAYAQLIMTYSTQLQQYSTQIQQLQNQYRQLANEAQNLRNLNWQAPLSELNNVGQVMLSASGIAASYATAQNQFQRLYPDFNGYSGMKGSAYIRQATAWQNQNRNAAMDTVRVQAMLRDAFGTDQNSLNEASNRSAGAQGTRDAIQATNQLLAVVSKQLMQLQQLVASTASLDAGYAAERASKEAAAQQRNQERFNGWNIKGARTVRADWGSLH